MIACMLSNSALPPCRPIGDFRIDRFKRVLAGIAGLPYLVDPQGMPWPSYPAMNDTDVHCLR